ncbi:hypothetical protein D3C80_859980 [compost metagenome]
MTDRHKFEYGGRLQDRGVYLDAFALDAMAVQCQKLFGSIRDDVLEVPGRMCQHGNDGFTMWESLDGRGYCSVSGDERRRDLVRQVRKRRKLLKGIWQSIGNEPLFASGNRSQLEV